MPKQFKKHYSIDQKIKYYAERVKDISLTSNQRKYAELKCIQLEFDKASGKYDKNYVKEFGTNNKQRIISKNQAYKKKRPVKEKRYEMLFSNSNATHTIKRYFTEKEAVEFSKRHNMIIVGGREVY